METDRGKECKSLKEWIGWYSSRVQLGFTRGDLGEHWLHWEFCLFYIRWFWSLWTQNGMDTNGINLLFHSLMVKDKYFLWNRNHSWSRQVFTWNNKTLSSFQPFLSYFFFGKNPSLFSKKIFSHKMDMWATWHNEKPPFLLM